MRPLRRRQQEHHMRDAAARITGSDESSGARPRGLDHAAILRAPRERAGSTATSSSPANANRGRASPPDGRTPDAAGATSVTSNAPPSPRPQTSGKYCSYEVAGGTLNAPGVVARAKYVYS